ncbi:MAG: hypothetical protein HGA42_01535 [Nostocales cyanobacterium W4_Combined_metabat2_030]|nr:hypothetical protein [Nostocales cyanobacterium W4_Combined_metabat2_030]
MKHLALTQTVQTMDSCKISWGEVVETGKNNKELTVRTKHLRMDEMNLRLGKEETAQVRLDYKKKTFLYGIKVGDWVSFHWGQVCDVLTMQQVKNRKTIRYCRIFRRKAF